MSGSVVRRVFAALLAVWFGFTTIQPATAAPCPHHEPALVQLAAVMVHASSASTMHHAMMLHASHGSDGEHNHGSTHQCTCMGACCTIAAVAIVVPALTFAPPTIVIGTHHPLPPIALHARQFPPHTLPYPTAPPQSLIV